ncbi:MAG: hypothetical protein AAFX79_03600 [Planctomycetota bacterium]
MSNTEPRSDSPSPPDRDLLITRVVDDAASAQDWALLRAMAEDDPSLWRELFEAQHAQAELARIVGDAISVADGVEVPLDQLPAGRLRPVAVVRAAGWVGWAAAAVVAAWMLPQAFGLGGAPDREGTMVAADPPPADPPPVAPPQAPADWVGQQASAGQLVGEESIDIARAPSFDETDYFVGPLEQVPTTLVREGLEQRRAQAAAELRREMAGDAGGSRPGMVSPGEPFMLASAGESSELPERMLLQARRLPDGRVELVYLRRFVERTVIDEADLYQVKPDDTNTPRPVPMRLSRPTSGPM